MHNECVDAAREETDPQDHVDDQPTSFEKRLLAQSPLCSSQHRSRQLRTSYSSRSLLKRTPLPLPCPFPAVSPRASAMWRMALHDLSGKARMSANLSLSPG